MDAPKHGIHQHPHNPACCSRVAYQPTANPNRERQSKLVWCTTRTRAWSLSALSQLHIFGRLGCTLDLIFVPGQYLPSACPCSLAVNSFLSSFISSSIHPKLSCRLSPVCSSHQAIAFSELSILALSSLTRQPRVSAHYISP